MNLYLLLLYRMGLRGILDSCIIFYTLLFIRFFQRINPEIIGCTFIYNIEWGIKSSILIISLACNYIEDNCFRLIALKQFYYFFVNLFSSHLILNRRRIKAGKIDFDSVICIIPLGHWSIKQSLTEMRSNITAHY